MSLYLGLVDENYPHNSYDKYIWMGQCCENGLLWCESNFKEALILDNPWNEKKYSDKVEAYINRIKNRMLEYLSFLLNEKHHEHYPVARWKILLTYWLDVFLVSYYDKYLKLKKLLDFDEEFDVTVADSRNLIIPIDTMDMLQKSETNGFQLLQYTLLINEMPQVKRKLKEKTIVLSSEKSVYPKINKPQHVDEFVKHFKEFKDEKGLNDEIVIQNPYIKFDLYKKIIEHGQGKISGYFYDYFSEVRSCLEMTVDYDWRLKKNPKNNQVVDDEFERIIFDIVLKALPISFVEGFSFLRDMALSNYKYALKPRAIIYEGGGILYNEMFKVYMMNADIEKAIKIDVQHGGGYGLWMEQLYKTEYALSDIFWTSGWCGEKRHTSFEKMPFIKFFRLANDTQVKNEYILYTSYTGYKYPTRLKLSDLKSKDYMEEEIVFLSSIKKTVKEQMLVRLYDVDKNYGWRYGDNIIDRVEGIRFDNETDFYKSLKKSKLLVTELFYTTIMEGLFLNIPVLAFKGPDYLGCQDGNCLKEEIDGLREVGVIADTPEVLASTLNSIYDSVDEWWNEPHRQRAVQAFKDKYCYFPENSEQIWIDKILELANS